MKKSIVLILIAIVTTTAVNCAPSTETTITYPKPNLCSRNADCLEGQYCGFFPGDTVAVCRGQAVSKQYNLD